MREMRNHFRHEYPNDLDLNAENLNFAILYSKNLINYWSQLEQKIIKISQTLP